MKKTVSLLTFIIASGRIFCQDTLPQFTLNDRGNKVTISWTNAYESLIQLNVQSSYDSLKNFRTIFSPPSPGLPQNGYTDTKAPSNRIFYRIFYVLEGGNYFFTVSKRAGGPPTETVSTSRDISNAALLNARYNDKRLITIKIKDEVYRQVPAYAFRNFRDSVLRQTKDTLFAINDSLISLSPYISSEMLRPSIYVFMDKNGYISINVPAVGERKYSIKFFEENGSPVFEIRNVKESPLILDKSNFVHAGWYLFELYEDNRLKEKNKFYLPKDF